MAGSQGRWALVLQEDFAVILDLFAVRQHLGHNRLGISAVLELDNHLQSHEVDSSLLDTGRLIGGNFHLVGAVCAIHIDLISLFHGTTLLNTHFI